METTQILKSSSREVQSIYKKFEKVDMTGDLLIKWSYKNKIGWDLFQNYWRGVSLDKITKSVLVLFKLLVWF